MKLRIGSRRSPLARWQAEYVATMLGDFDIETEMVWIVTEGDQTTTPLAQAAGTGVFTKAIQRALLAGQCDIAVHSLKDLPTVEIEGLTLAAVPPRQDVRDCFLSAQYRSLDELPAGARVGTGSPRRIAQILALRPDLQLESIRGNVESRIEKMERGDYDAIVLAAAGLHRLGLNHRITSYFDTAEMLPAVGQAALGIECRRDDSRTFDAIRSLNDPAAWRCVAAERALLRHLQSGCLTPVATLATIRDQTLHMRARWFNDAMDHCIRTETSGPVAAPNSADVRDDDAPHAVGIRAAELLLLGGATRG